MTTTISRADRERMADDLDALGLRATGGAVRAGTLALTLGVEHVRHYVLTDVVRAVKAREEYDAQYPPTPGTWGAVALSNIRERRDELQRFLDDWAAYDFQGGQQ